MARGRMGLPDPHALHHFLRTLSPVMDEPLSSQMQRWEHLCAAMEELKWARHSTPSPEEVTMNELEQQSTARANRPIKLMCALCEGGFIPQESPLYRMSQAFRQLEKFQSQGASFLMDGKGWETLGSLSHLTGSKTVSPAAFQPPAADLLQTINQTLSQMDEGRRQRLVQTAQQILASRH